MKYDALIIGAGLSGGLLALALSKAQPDAKILLLDKAKKAPDAKTWSFHETDLSPEWLEYLRPYLRQFWKGQSVRFPAHSRELKAGYASLDAKGLEAALKAQGISPQRGATITALGKTRAELADGTRLEAGVVIDARGFEPSKFARNGWQKFVGFEYEMNAPHGVHAPVIMDADVEQIEGYRFVYLLPFGETKILIEDTRYSDDPEIDEAGFAKKIEAYVKAQGWQGKIIRREQGVLPIPLAYDAKAFWRAPHEAVPIGMQAGLFHPVTGYSLPVAAKLADQLANTPLTQNAFHDVVRDFALEKEKTDRYLRLLNRMLFNGAPPDERYRLLERFYRLPEPLIERFYSGELTKKDQMRILTGKPPIKLSAAIQCLPEKPLLEDKK